MNTKLTLRLDEKLIASATRHSAESGKSVSLDSIPLSSSPQCTPIRRCERSSM